MDSGGGAPFDASFGDPVTTQHNGENLVYSGAHITGTSDSWPEVVLGSTFRGSLPRLTAASTSS
ncbi:hypothetical protein [Haloarchaeobius litoreus]|uniref:Uncharacterized protein n=1 Tax=Haloarchaeobius litoreus TaxID=755306 RepID=A0ABD6DH46_9EURY|nr:hypothetical protein [Haloarchaeobius litoreus]